jgi:signal transduction histidine kinase
MPSLKSRQKRFFLILSVFLILVFSTWIGYYTIGFGSFNKGNAVTIFGSVIEGMSALLSVAIAVIIFRIQSLENRNQSLEQSTLNYIHQTVGWSYPSWAYSLEKDIRNKIITKRYLSLMRMRRMEATSLEISQEEEKSLLEERDRQQRRLEENLNLRKKITEIIETTKGRFYKSAIVLIMPILSSLLFMMISDAFDSFWNFVFVSEAVLLSAFGITLLIWIVLESILEPKSE